MAHKPETAIQYLKGVGPKLGAMLSKKGIKTLGDLLDFYPRAYEDRRAARNISSLKKDEVVSLKAEVIRVSSYQLGKSKRKIYDVSIRDASGVIHCKFFRVPYRGYFERFQTRQPVRVVGKVTDYRGRLEFHHPDLREIGEEDEVMDAIVPIYVELEGLSSAKIGRMVQTALSAIEEWPHEKFPKWIQEKYQLMDHKKAVELLHLPPAEHGARYIDLKSEAHKRIIFEEFFWLELLLASRKVGFKKERAPVIKGEKKVQDKIRSLLPFQLTNAQERALQEIFYDLQTGHPMHRLVQGDVGSGKTLLAFLAAAQAYAGGFQSCLMAPTEILAEQHARNAEKYLSPAGIKVGVLTGKMKVAEKREIIERLKLGELHFVIGTHALIESDVEFRNLGLVVIDEQHRFGVGQRMSLKQKGHSPHFLIMTATPIPRTLAMTVYGDLEVSIIDELPPGRSPIQTRVTYESKRSQVLQFMLDQIKKGRQAYVIYPLVEESEKIDLKNAIEEFEKLQTLFPEVQFGLLHGRMKGEEKDAIMQEFRDKKIQVLVSTTVIEVGVDVPNANIIVIEHAERFGLSQLHQLRGRVGRGEHKSFCVLVLGYAVSEEARERTQFMETTNDGFKIAEFDLQMRGPGEFMGTRQSGLAGFKMANLVRDIEILTQARKAALEVLEKDPGLKFLEHKELREELLRAHGPMALAAIG
ncbi:MAG: ATP-dependent DNA helicase RecG [Pseudobdellovibrionaceae bacterium]